MSTYFGSITIVLKLPLTSAASANGLQRYSALLPGVGDGGACVAIGSLARKLGEVGVVGDRRGFRGARRLSLFQFDSLERGSDIPKSIEKRH